MKLCITPLISIAPDALPVEIAERKGRGHPDTLCDLLAEAVSIGLSQQYLERFGTVLHHNVDKALLLGGAARPAFGGGEVLAPIEIILGGRATQRLAGVTIPVEEIAFECAHAWLVANVRHLDTGDVRIVPRIRETSQDLAALFQRRSDGAAPLANDTSFGVGYAPLDRLERAVLAVEQRLASKEVKRMYPELGDDTKVLGARDGNAITITVACAFVGRYVSDLTDYQVKKQRMRSLVKHAAQEAAGAATEVEVGVNTADGETMDSIYLTVTGLSAEAGDDGQVGRGNRVNGLITPYRPMSLEAAAGKNAVTHTGKIYNLLAERIAHTLVREIAEVEHAQCFLLSRIGSPIDEPALAEIRLNVAEPGAIATLEPAVREIVRAHLRGAACLWRDVTAGRCGVC